MTAKPLPTPDPGAAEIRYLIDHQIGMQGDHCASCGHDSDELVGHETVYVEIDGEYGSRYAYCYPCGETALQGDEVTGYWYGADWFLDTQEEE